MKAREAKGNNEFVCLDDSAETKMYNKRLKIQQEGGSCGEPWPSTRWKDIEHKRRTGIA